MAGSSALAGPLRLTVGARTAQPTGRSLTAIKQG